MGNKLDHPSIELPPEKLVMVTGGNTGIGYETAKSLAERGAKVCIACRSEDKARAAIERMQAEHQEELHKKRASAQAQAKPSEAGDDGQQPGEEEVIKPLNLDFIKLDLSSLQSTMDFVQEVKERMNSLHTLVCNAGIAYVKQECTADKFESHFQVNYLSHLLLTIHLMPLLRAGGPDSRVVLLSSGAHVSGTLDLENVQGQRSYNRFTFYSCSKAYMIMAAHFLARRLEETGVTTYAVDPGFVDTEITQPWSLIFTLVKVIAKLGMLRTPRQGAATSVVTCVDPALSGKTAVYMKSCRPSSPSSFCLDESKQELLWNYSLECLDEFINDEVLREAFPSAKANLLVIPKKVRPADEVAPDDPAGQGSSGDDEQVIKGGQVGEDEALLVVHPEMPKMTQETGGMDQDMQEKALQDDSAEPLSEAVEEVRLPEGETATEDAAAEEDMQQEALKDDCAEDVTAMEEDTQQKALQDDSAGPATEAVEVRVLEEETATEDVAAAAEEDKQQKALQDDSAGPATEAGEVRVLEEETVTEDIAAAEEDKQEKALQDDSEGPSSEAVEEVRVLEEERATEDAAAAEEDTQKATQEEALQDGTAGPVSEAVEELRVPEEETATEDAAAEEDTQQKTLQDDSPEDATATEQDTPEKALQDDTEALKLEAGEARLSEKERQT